MNKLTVVVLAITLWWLGGKMDAYFADDNADDQATQAELERFEAIKAQEAETNHIEPGITLEALLSEGC